MEILLKGQLGSKQEKYVNHRENQAVTLLRAMLLTFLILLPFEVLHGTAASLSCIPEATIRMATITTTAFKFIPFYLVSTGYSLVLCTLHTLVIAPFSLGIYIFFTCRNDSTRTC